MDKKEFLEDRRRALKKSVEFFSTNNKPERERYVCTAFVKNLGITFDETEVVSSNDDPPDVVFRDAKFEIKEVLDPGRRRHDEYKDALEVALNTTDSKNLLEPWITQDITPVQIGDRILSALEGLKNHYAPSVRAHLDLLFYVNLQDHCLIDGPMPEVKTFASFGWRSISTVFGFGGFVFFATPEAPSFLHSKVGAVTYSPRRAQ